MPTFTKTVGAATNSLPVSQIFSPVAPSPPQAPITTITDAPSLAINAHSSSVETFTDYVINGTGDSAVLFQPPSHDNVMRRVTMTRVAAGNSVPQAKHGIYCKARGNLVTDVDMTASQFAVDGLSIRMGNNTFQRIATHGFIFPIAYFEHDDVAGTVLCEDITGDGTETAAIFGDDSNGCLQPYIKQAFTFRRVWLTCPGTNFLVFGNSVFSGAGLAFNGAYVHLENCRLNGSPVTLSQIQGVPTNKITIQ